MFGISFEDSHNNTLKKNNCSSNINGINLSLSNHNILSNNIITENKVGIYLNGSSIGNIARYNNIHDNNEYGINATYNDGFGINATYDWWGDDSGPYHPTENPEGKGDSVTDYVEFKPWLPTAISPNIESPILTITGPQNNSKVSGIIFIRCTAFDPEGANISYEISIDNGKWLRITNASSLNFQLDTRELKDGNCLIRIRAHNGQYYSETQTLSLTVKNKDEDTDTLFPSPLPAAVGIVAVSSIGLFGLAFLREDLRFALLSLLTIPLYTKLEKDEILNQASRHDIYSYLTNNPGVNYTRILKELNLGTSTLVYHLKVLEREGFIRSKKAMGRRLFFPKTANFTIDPLASSLPPSPVQKKIVEYLKDNGPASRFDIEHALSLKRQTVSYSVRRLEERGLIKCSGNGRKDLCEASEL